MYSSPSMDSPVLKKGKLYVVATPIGNLDDFSVRALNTLKNVSVVLSEDTRETDKLFRKYSIQNKQISYRDQNHDRIYPQVKDILNAGQDLAIVSDSGTPVISDPGFKLVSQLADEGYEIVSIPGPSAIISALSISGLPTDKFTFLGFLPKSSTQRKNLLTQYGQLDTTIIIYESPFRIGKMLDEISEALGDRYVVLANDLTKMYEKLQRGKVSELITQFSGKQNKFKGEFVVLIAKKDFK